MRIVRFLAAAGRPATSREIALRTGIPSGHVPSIVAALSRAGILRTRPGQGGGCALARRPAELFVLDVIQALEGPVVLDECILDRSRPHGPPWCALHDSWMQVQDALVATLGAVSVADLVASGGEGAGSGLEAPTGYVGSS
ncbi:MAG: Rrf2 family transcriptional regulator [Actinobacteria bacterium]|nr:Rrf2 family transcriptional regulator [Actinomycetota bacterium]